MLNRTIATPIKDAIDFGITLKECTRISLTNGVPVYYINDGAEEVADQAGHPGERRRRGR